MKKQVFIVVLWKDEGHTKKVEYRFSSSAKVRKFIEDVDEDDFYELEIAWNKAADKALKAS